MSFTFNFTVDQVEQILHPNHEYQAWYDALCDELPKYEINTPERVAMFMAQCAHESANFTTFKENLNYSAKGLMGIWPSRFPADVAEEYQHKPEKIANRAYCNRMGNCDEASGDGWKFHGRGLIQMTGRELYEAFAKEIGKELEDAITYCETDDGAVESATFFWEHHKLNVHSDAGDVKLVTHIINGGYLGLEDRESKYNHALQLFQS